MSNNPGVGPSVADLPFPSPVSDDQRIANALWLIENNPTGKALPPAEIDEAPHYSHDASSPQIGRVLLAGDVEDVTTCSKPMPDGAAQRDDYLHFDGTKLRWWSGDGKLKGQWHGASGASQFQRERDLSMKDKGPLPPGIWDVRQDQYQTLSLWNELTGTLGAAIGQKRGEWPGGSTAWGSKRIWLQPTEGTNTFGRENFSVHGGSFPGSAGCIDLTGSMDAFAKMFREHGKDLKLYVDYGRE